MPSNSDLTCWTILRAASCGDEKARAEFDRDTRGAHYREIHQLVYDDQPYLFLWDYAMLYAFNRRIGGVESAPAGYFLFYPSHRAWWARREGTY